MKSEIRKYLGLGIVLFLTWLAINYWPVLMLALGAIAKAARPLLYGAVIAYVVGILMGLYEKIWFPNSRNRLIQKSRSVVCMLFSLVSIALALVFLMNLVVPQLLACIQLLVKEIPPLVQQLIDYLKAQENLLPNLADFLANANFDWDTIIKKGVGYITSGVTGIMSGAVGAATSFVASIPDIVFTLIFAMYMLLGKHTLLRQFKRLLKAYTSDEVRDKVNYVSGVAHSSFRSFVIGQVTEAILLGALCTAGMLLLRLPYAGMTGAVVGFTALIPIVGAYIGTIVGAFVIFTVSPIQALVFVVFLLVLQQIEGNLIYPHTVGSSIGLPGIWVLAAVTICGGLFGVPGMLIGVPAMATVYRLLKADINKRDPQ